jgi:acetoin utilization deacetylase AcuC-like enzyme
MKIYYSDEHAAHAPEVFVNRGQVKASPEVPARADALLDAVRHGGHAVCDIRRFGLDAVGEVHDAGYLDFLAHAHSLWQELPDCSAEVVPNVHPGRHMAGKPRTIVGLAGYYQADCACPIGAGTWRAAQAAADTALSAAEVVMQAGGEDFAYGLCRPPGHHAFADMAGGFCFLNNTAIAAQYCRDQGAGRVAIVDVDVHHGNGTQGIFYGRADVLTVSLHGDPAHFYPFYMGYAEEIGEGDGRGCNMNVPLPRDSGDEAFMENLREALARVRGFEPEVLVVALGLDASEHDPLAFLRITNEGFRRIGSALGGLGLPTVIVQEGGYLTEHLGANLVAALDGFASAR